MHRSNRQLLGTIGLGFARGDQRKVTPRPSRRREPLTPANPIHSGTTSAPLNGRGSISCPC